jgi:hypothetical protein
MKRLKNHPTILQFVAKIYCFTTYCVSCGEVLHAQMIKKEEMKKVMFVLLMMFLSLPIFAQDVEPPTNWLDLFANINVWLGSLAGVAAVTVFLAAAVNTLFKVTKGFLKQTIAWLIAIVLLVTGNFVNMGFMADLNWWHTLIYGIAAGFVANGIFDIELVRLLLQAFKIEAKT